MSALWASIMELCCVAMYSARKCVPNSSVCTYLCTLLHEYYNRSGLFGMSRGLDFYPCTIAMGLFVYGGLVLNSEFRYYNVDVGGTFLCLSGDLITVTSHYHYCCRD